MRRPRVQFRMSLLMASVATTALGLAALKDPSEPQLSIVFTLTVAAFLISALLARYALTSAGRNWWFGFCLFGATHLLLVASTWRDRLPTATFVDRCVLFLTTHVGPYPTPAGGGSWYTNAMHNANNQYYFDVKKVIEIYLSFGFAIAGAILTVYLAPWIGKRRPMGEDQTDPAGSIP